MKPYMSINKTALIYLQMTLVSHTKKYKKKK